MSLSPKQHKISHYLQSLIKLRNRSKLVKDYEEDNEYIFLMFFYVLYSICVDPDKYC